MAQGKLRTEDLPSVRPAETPAGSAVQGEASVSARNPERVKEASTELWKVYGTLNEWIRFNDAKAGAVLTANGVLVGAALTVLKDNRVFVLGHSGILIASALALISVVISSVYCLLCIAPSVGSGAATSLIFFDHITRQFDKPEDYADAVHDRLTDPEQAFQQISQQVHANATVASRKTRKVYLAVCALSIALIFGGIATLLAAIRS